MIEKQLLLIQKALSVKGLAKNQTNAQQHFNYRGIDQLLNEVSPLLVKHDVILLPQLVDTTSEPFLTSGGKPFYRVNVSVVYEFIHVSEAGEKTSLSVKTRGEGSDQMDKALSKAMSSAYKYLWIQMFAIPLVGRDDPDAQGISEDGDDVTDVLNEAEIKAIQEMINGINKLVDKPLHVGEWCQWLCGVDSLAEIPKDQIGRAGNALAAIQRKHERAAEGASNTAIGTT